MLREKVMNDSGSLSLIFRVLAFAAEKHRVQRRKDAEGSAYINHPIALANVLINEAQVNDLVTICAALLHDTLEDTETTLEELERHFGNAVASVVFEVSDDKSLPKETRKQLQIEHAPALSLEAKLVKLADKICNLRDVASHPPAGWSIVRKRAYFDWARQVVDGVRGVNPKLEAIFDEAYARRP